MIAAPARLAQILLLGAVKIRTLVEMRQSKSAYQLPHYLSQFLFVCILDLLIEINNSLNLLYEVRY